MVNCNMQGMLGLHAGWLGKLPSTIYLACAAYKWAWGAFHVTAETSGVAETCLPITAAITGLQDTSGHHGLHGSLPG